MKLKAGVVVLAVGAAAVLVAVVGPAALFHEKVELVRNDDPVLPVLGAAVDAGGADPPGAGLEKEKPPALAPAPAVDVVAADGNSDDAEVPPAAPGAGAGAVPNEKPLEPPGVVVAPPAPPNSEGVAGAGVVVVAEAAPKGLAGVAGAGVVAAPPKATPV